jgi:magnesium transporter
MKKKLRSRKAGLAPGALVHIGEIKTAAPTLSLIDFGPETYAEHELFDLASLDAVPRVPGVRWLNVHGVHDVALLGAIGERFSLHPLVIEDILNTDQRPKADDYDNYLFIVTHLYDLSRDPIEIVRDQISLVVGHDFVLSFQERPSGTFAPIRQRLRAEKSPLRRMGGDYPGPSHSNIIEVEFPRWPLGYRHPKQRACASGASWFWPGRLSLGGAC